MNDDPLQKRVMMFVQQLKNNTKVKIYIFSFTVKYFFKFFSDYVLLFVHNSTYHYSLQNV